MKFLFLWLLFCTLAVAQAPPTLTFPYSVTLSWLPSTSTGITAQNISRAPFVSGACGVFAPVAKNLAPAVSDYTDVSVGSNIAYCYEVEAIASDGTATSTPLTNVQIPPAPPTGIKATVNTAS